ncbi:hypothetical protein BWQ96_01751 [Gracilariopsis chorda]|uniref:Uncharacterized protein n=1 Tax=Gracilariopsis chorda TaxID=448386 RepID=A0A2V3J391_9FLOR|nr:hypothetical protein BWQ96_01751 [Gracilariopsis chorda]|eukprot:PXF48582.1 hypothetical protein BWQ96_01751 [Gracilariopsis chorda]
MNLCVKRKLSGHFKRPSSASQRKSSRVRRKPGEWWKGTHRSSLQRISWGSLDTPQQLARKASALDAIQDSRTVSKELYTSSSPQTPECLRSCSSVFQESARPNKTKDCTSDKPRTGSHPKITGSSSCEDATVAATPFMPVIFDQNQTSPNLHMTIHPKMQVSRESYSEADAGLCSSEVLEPNKNQQTAFPSRETTNLCATFNMAEDRESSQNYPDPKSESSGPPRTPASEECCSVLRTRDTTASRNHILSDHRQDTPHTYSCRSVSVRDCGGIGKQDTQPRGLEVPITSGADMDTFSYREGTGYSVPAVLPGKNLHRVTDSLIRQISPGAGTRGEEQRNHVNLLESLNHGKPGFQTHCLRQENDYCACCVRRHLLHPHAPVQESNSEALPVEPVCIENRKNCSLCSCETCTCIERETNTEKSRRAFTVRRGSQMTYNTERDVFGMMKLGIRMSEDGIMLGELTLFPMSSTGRRKTTGHREYYFVLSGYLVLDVEDTTLHLRRGDEVEFCEDTVFQLRNPCLRATDLFCFLVAKV